jgi:hypothetical protein
VARAPAQIIGDLVFPYDEIRYSTIHAVKMRRDEEGITQAIFLWLHLALADSGSIQHYALFRWGQTHYHSS